MTWYTIIGGGDFPSGFGMKPVSNPGGSFALTQGLGKVDWVRVWFFARKLKVIMSPTAAATVGGE